METLYEKELSVRRAIQRRLRGNMTYRDNVLYFPNNIDVRICPKNGISTLKWALWYTHGLPYKGNELLARRVGTVNHRREEIKKHGFPLDYPFREGSRRIAIVRDPIERFLSAAEYLKHQWQSNRDIVNGVDPSKVWENLSDQDLIPDNIDDVIDGVYHGEIVNSHFYTQAYYLGSRSQYSEIYKFSEFSKFMTYLQNECKSPLALDNIKINATDKSYFGHVSSLTEDQKDRIIAIYKEDYEYGWTEKNARSL